MNFIPFCKKIVRKHQFLQVGLLFTLTSTSQLQAAGVFPYTCTTAGTRLIDVWPSNPGTGPGNSAGLVVWGAGYSPMDDSKVTSTQMVDETTLNAYKATIGRNTFLKRHYYLACGPGSVDAYEYLPSDFGSGLPASWIGTNPAPGYAVQNNGGNFSVAGQATTNNRNAMQVNCKNPTPGTLYGWIIRMEEQLGYSALWSGVTSATLNFSTPNEYLANTIRFTYSARSIIGLTPLENNFGYGATWGDLIFMSAAPLTVICTRSATPLTLTLEPKDINFGSLLLGSNTPVTHPLRWSATGTGQAGVWTLTFEPEATDSSGKYISLGGAKVSVLDGGNLVALNEPVTISGTSGNYTLSLDPGNANPGPQAVNLNIILTAN